ncbi:transglycosylase domain-containing protein [Brevibacillus fulvus]|uniref:Penicillin-binding protein n=1 Tax=Brevibacillus fulvus TaxID=1125967 RepID=A0A938XZZ9_9BACL|nr:transglycosylase domain-containing protein [Brevibacillus fulvus]MBM7590795.1 penicillin-binding protein [Brevibacillus fulvus]
MQNTHSPASNSTKRKRRRYGKGRIVLAIVKLAVLLGLIGLFIAGGVVVGYVASLVKDEPVRTYAEYHQKIFSNYLTGFVYYSDGSLIGQLRAEEDRRLVKIPDVSPYLINAIIATEDRNFYTHHGVSFQSTLRAAYQELTHQTVVTGGSTLTQQLIKRTILGTEVTHARKAKEIFNALRLERMFTKDQILEAYINEIYLGKNANGSNIYGVQAAAKGIFNKEVKDLDLAEASYIAGLPQSPSAYSPFTTEGFKRGKERQKIVLQSMLEAGKITQQEYEQALAVDLETRLAKPTKLAYSELPFLMMEIEERASKALVDSELAEQGRDKETVGNNEYQQLVEEKRREILRNGYKIYTTINKDANRIMQDIAADPKNFGKNRTYTIRRSNGKTEKIENALEETGAMLIQNKTGAILGMIGGRDFNVEQTNHATVPRQPGSAMKPLAAYAPAFELGLLQPGSPIDDSPLVLSDGQNGTHTPLNWDNKYHGIMSTREALRQSWNVPAIKTYLKVGITTALEYVKKMGVTTLVDSDNHAATGVIGGLAYGLTAEEITNAYATFANRGTFIDAYMIDRIEDSEGKVIYKHQIQPVPVFSEQTSYLITDMMRTVVNSGTGAHVRNYVPRSVDIAGKTGTTNSSNDLWFVGYTPELSMGVWVGFDEPYPMPDADKYFPMMIWGKVMKEIVDTIPSLSPPDAKFEKPDGIVSLTVDSKSGLLPSELSKQTGHLITDLFNRQFIPTKTDDGHQKAKIVQYNGQRYLAKEGTPDDFVSEGIFYRGPEPIVDSPEVVKTTTARPPDWEQRLPSQEDPRVEVSGTPAAPSAVKATTSGNNVVLTWKSGGEADLLGYRLYRAGTDQSFVKIATIKDPAALSYTDTGAASAGYGYYLTAVDVTGQESSPSEVVSAGSTIEWQSPAQPVLGEQPAQSPEQQTEQSHFEQQVPSPPTGLSVSKSAGGMSLNWNSNAAADEVITYNVYYAPNPSEGFLLLGSVTDTSYFFDGVSSGQFYITAVNQIGESSPSAYAALSAE